MLNNEERKLQYLPMDAVYPCYHCLLFVERCYLVGIECSVTRFQKFYGYGVNYTTFLTYLFYLNVLRKLSTLRRVQLSALSMRTKNWSASFWGILT